VSDIGPADWATDREAVAKLLRRATGPHDDDRVRSMLTQYERGAWSLFVLRQSGTVVAVLGVSGGEQITIQHVAVAASVERNGLASRLLKMLTESEGWKRIVAETDDEGVGFYVKTGFVVTQVASPHPSVNRYSCVLDVGSEPARPAPAT